MRLRGVGRACRRGVCHRRGAGHRGARGRVRPGRRPRLVPRRRRRRFLVIADDLPARAAPTCVTSGRTTASTRRAVTTIWDRDGETTSMLRWCGGRRVGQRPASTLLMPVVTRGGSTSRKTARTRHRTRRSELSSSPGRWLGRRATGLSAARSMGTRTASRRQAIRRGVRSTRKPMSTRWSGGTGGTRSSATSR